MRLIDTHAHLDAGEFRRDREAVVARAFSEKVGVVTVGVDLPSSEATVSLAGRYRFVWAAVGVHPHEAKTVNAGVLDRLLELTRLDKVVAVGEIGLDYYRDLSAREVQQRVFREQLELAYKLSLPVIIHDRASTDDLLAILQEKGADYRGVVHSFLGDRELAKEFLALGFHLGIGGPITFSQNKALRDAVKAMPMERILLETDCPYLTPVPYRGKRNEPVYVRFVAHQIAEVKSVGTEVVAKQTTENARRLFGLPD